jgi:hypothetical protein
MGLRRLTDEPLHVEPALIGVGAEPNVPAKTVVLQGSEPKPSASADQKMGRT